MALSADRRGLRDYAMGRAARLRRLAKHRPLTGDEGSELAALRSGRRRAAIELEIAELHLRIRALRATLAAE